MDYEFMWNKLEQDILQMMMINHDSIEIFNCTGTEKAIGYAIENCFNTILNRMNQIKNNIEEE